MVLLPILGYITDKGSNPKLRKMLALYVAMAGFLCGLGLLIACGFVKLASQGFPSTNNITGLPNMTVSTEPTFEVPGNFSGNSWVSSLNAEATTAKSSEVGQHSDIPATAFMSITGFALIDIGFDMSVSLTRAFILENTPTFQHTRLLVLATVVASMAGTTFSIIGCFDFPRILGPIFQVEGVAAALIFFCSLLITTTIIGYSCTTITGILISRQPQASDTTSDHRTASFHQSQQSRDPGTPRVSRRRIRGRSQSQLQKLREDRPYVPDILHTEQGDTSTRPLLLEDSTKGYNYSAISNGSAVLYSIKDMVDGSSSDTEVATNNALRTSSMDDVSQTEPDNKDKVDTQDNKVDDVSDTEDAVMPLYEQQHVDSNVSAVLAAIRQSYSMSMSVMQSPLGDFHNRKLQQLQEKRPTGQGTDSKARLKTRLAILTVSSFFTVGSSLGFIVYVSNTLTVGIFHGDPTAAVGTEGYQLYEKGLQTAALGNLVLYSAYMLVSLNNTKIIDLIGEKLQFVLCHVFLIVSLLAVILTQRLEAYYVFMVFCGAFRTCAFTLPFVLANKFTQEENDNSSKGQPSRNLGKVMTLIGFLMPTHFILMSSFMGPLMDATSNVWVPLIYSLGSCTVSLIIFSSLFFIKT
ncbi:unnamed protein product [Candidula unifasciata]|uniref:Uncharacterized protein n=1 Tax=Candidula unifasciata TaxID=100452 RepID=A0A8S3YHQ9_9EUPU|nr:unnamed protein product [Candidula unifasciata]